MDYLKNLNDIRDRMKAQTTSNADLYKEYLKSAVQFWGEYSYGTSNSAKEAFENELGKTNFRKGTPSITFISRALIRSSDFDNAQIPSEIRRVFKNTGITDERSLHLFLANISKMSWAAIKAQYCAAPKVNDDPKAIFAQNLAKWEAAPLMATPLDNKNVPASMAEDVALCVTMMNKKTGKLDILHVYATGNDNIVDALSTKQKRKVA
ncbi:hypothetical protein D3W54_16000 (plasmid) [Komagataeibacter medellinensis]|uniref:Uncharacterized protein n=1 Tax=Komagataeibacter medellinensis TaxID=1177712 RepID=A0ABQ6VR04_9PROT|nr:hypothetical protein [Komagataeibacter medellinensis]KAB8122211.1 hypothetical protein D3W54_16000 [Komagataeibacter medellinensis]